MLQLEFTILLAASALQAVVFTLNSCYNLQRGISKCESSTHEVKIRKFCGQRPRFSIR